MYNNIDTKRIEPELLDVNLKIIMVLYSAEAVSCDGGFLLMSRALNIFCWDIMYTNCAAVAENCLRHCYQSKWQIDTLYFQKF